MSTVIVQVSDGNYRKLNNIEKPPSHKITIDKDKN